MDALSEMCKREHGRLVGLLGLYCGDRNIAEDLTQEALVRLCRDWRTVRKLDSPEAWLHRVAINLAHSHFRRRRVERLALSRLKNGDLKLLGSAEHDVETIDLLAGLPRKEREAILLHYYLDLSVREVAEIMHRPEGTVKTLIHRGTKKLRAGTPSLEAIR